MPESFDKAFHRHWDDVEKLKAHFKTNSLHNVLQKVCALEESLSEAKKALTDLTDEICSLAGTTPISNAKRRIAALSGKASALPSVIARYNLDHTFLDKPSPAWKTLIDINKDNWELHLKKSEKAREQRRMRCVRMHSEYLLDVIQVCADEGIPEEDFQHYLNVANDQIKEDYLTLEYIDFWKKYDYELGITTRVIEQSSQVDFSEALPLVENFAPEQLLKDLSKSRKMLGTVSRVQFEKWDTNYASWMEEATKTGLPKLRKMMKTIVGGMAYRVISQEIDSWPSWEDESLFNLLLSTENENPSSLEWAVDDSTNLWQFCQKYRELANTK